MTLSADRPWSRIGQPRDCSAAAFMPFVQSSIVSSDNLLKDVRSNRDVEIIRMRRSDKDMIVADFNRRRLPAKICWSHSPHSTRNRFETTERFARESITHVRVKPNGLLNMGKTFRSLPTASLTRPTVVGCPT